MERRTAKTATPESGHFKTDWRETDWSSHVRDAVVMGRRVRYADVGTGPALILLHGLGCSWQWWLENIPVLAREHHVVAVDLPGFGHSEQLPLPAEMETQADVILELASQLGLQRAAVAGHSMGGLVALAMARRDPERITRIVLVNAGGVPISPLRLAIIVFVLRRFQILLRRTSLLPKLARRPRGRRLLLRLGMREPAVMSRELALETLPILAGPGFVDAIVAAARAVRAAGPEDLACPISLIWGAHDPLLPLSAAEELVSRMPGAQLQVIDNAGHTPMVEEPAEFNEALLRFLSGEAEGDG